jgi:hypothetical protein
MSIRRASIVGLLEESGPTGSIRQSQIPSVEVTGSNSKDVRRMETHRIRK